MKKIIALSVLAALSACSTMTPTAEVPDADAPSVTPPDKPQISPEPPARVSAGQSLGTTVATLGNAAEPGLWLKTPLVSSRQQGILISKDNGERVQVELIPIPGEATSGSRISLQAMQALGLPLTALAQIDVRAGV